MPRLRKIRKWGNVFVIVLKSVDMNDLDFKEGDDVDIENLVNLRS